MKTTVIDQKIMMALGQITSAHGTTVPGYTPREMRREVILYLRTEGIAEKAEHAARIAKMARNIESELRTNGV